MARGKKAGGWLVAVKWIAVLAAGVAGGYLWRSYHPLPVPQGTPLTSDDSAMRLRAERLASELADERRRAAEAEKEAARLLKELAKRDQGRENEQMLAADQQIKALLRGN